MPRYEQWIESQKVITAGVVATRIRLEGPDGVMATWDVRQENLTSIVESAIAVYGEEMPQGTYRGELKSFDESDQQLSYFPVTFRGKAPPASHASESKAFQQAASIMLGNVESLVQMQGAAIERLTKENSVLYEDRQAMLDALEANARLHAEIDITMKRAEAREERLNQFTRELKPLLELGVQFLGERFTAFMKTVEEKAVAAGSPPSESVGKALPEPSAPPVPKEPIAQAAAPEKEYPSAPNNQPGDSVRAAPADEPRPSESGHPERGERSSSQRAGRSQRTVENPKTNDRKRRK